MEHVTLLKSIKPLRTRYGIISRYQPTHVSLLRFLDRSNKRSFWKNIWLNETHDPIQIVKINSSKTCVALSFGCHEMATMNW